MRFCLKRQRRSGEYHARISACQLACSGDHFRPLGIVDDVFQADRGLPVRPETGWSSARSGVQAHGLHDDLDLLADCIGGSRSDQPLRADRRLRIA